MLAAASTLFGKSSTLSAYTVHSGPSPSSSSTNLASGTGPGGARSSGRSSPAPGAHAHPFNVGLWKVMSATHKTTGKDVSVWVFEKRVLDSLRSGRDYVIEQMKKEVRRANAFVHSVANNTGYVAIAPPPSGHSAHGRAAGGVAHRTHVCD
jgi:SCY1-like protein 2